MLGNMDGLRVLDLYAGSGALGIEALSRGAEHATFVESQRGAAAVLRENLEDLGLTTSATLAIVPVARERALNVKPAPTTTTGLRPRVDSSHATTSSASR